MRSQKILVVLLWGVISTGVGPVLAANLVDSDCLECHGQNSRVEETGALRIASSSLSISAHADLQCVECHVDIGILPHQAELQTVDCGSCHGEQTSSYQRSIHGLRTSSGDTTEPAATCVDCHGTHDIQAARVFRDPSHRLDIPDRCGQCHPAITETYRESIHGQAAGTGVVEAPICTDCHGEHTIASHVDPTSSVAPGNIPTTCAACHEEESIATKFDLPKRRFSTYLSSFHGVVNRYGEAAVANCASCHGVHDIRPSSDPQSAIHPDNLGKTCGTCHPGLEADLVDVKIHVEATPESSKGMYYVRTFYTYFIGALMICFVAYMAIEIYGTLRRRRS